MIVDTKSDVEALTQNALHAADLIILPVADWASLEEAGNAESPPRAEEPAEEGPPGEKGGSCDG